LGRPAKPEKTASLDQQKPIFDPPTMVTAGGACEILAANNAASKLVASLNKAMQLDLAAAPEMPADRRLTSRLLVNLSKDLEDHIPRGIGIASEDGDSIACRMCPTTDRDCLTLQMMWLSPLLIRGMERRGAMLLHGALAERDGVGVIFAGPGGSGKTTVSGRLRAPWRSLCDDTTLVVRDENGCYRAHPWPTWSRFMWGGPGGTWDVNYSVPLKAIFLLVKDKDMRVEPVGAAAATILLQEVAEQASFFFLSTIDEDSARAQRLQRFDNVCAVAKKVPTSILYTSLASPFWDEVERCLRGAEK